MAVSSGLHKELCLKAIRYLKSAKNCAFAVSEITTWCGQKPDCIGFKSGQSYLVEVKISRSDFLRDKKKQHFINPKLAIGKYRYYLCPEGLIEPEELPLGWGLLYYNKSIRQIKAAEPLVSCLEGENLILVSIVRRLVNDCPYIKPIMGYEQTTQKGG